MATASMVSATRSSGSRLWTWDLPPARLDPGLGGRRLANHRRTITLEAQTIAHACGKSHVHNLEPEDLVALTVESAAMARVPLAGTSWIPGQAF